MTIEDFKHKLKTTPKTIQFSETMSVIEANYNFTPTAFKNGNLANKSNENMGSCKLLAFAKNQELTKEETLACFGDFYYNDVLENPDGTSHQNIRNFMEFGFKGLHFEHHPLKQK